MTCSTTRLRTSECSAIPTQPPHAHTPPHVARRSRARTAHADSRRGSRSSRSGATSRSARSSSRSRSQMALPPTRALPPSNSTTRRTIEVQREHPKVKVQGVRHAPGRPARVRLQHLDLLHRIQRRCRVPEPCGRRRSGGGVTAAAPGFVMPALEFACMSSAC